MDIPATTTAAKTAPLCQTVARLAALAHGMTADVQKDTMTEGSDKHYPDVGLIIRHRDGGPSEDPLFTDFTASNIGTPANSRLPYYAEDRPDSRGYVANPAVSSFVHGGVGRFLRRNHLLSQPSAVDTNWLPLAPGNEARFQVPTLRNVDKRPHPDFVKAYTHNGYLKSLKSIVHFYNTRDVLQRCQPNDPGEGTTCWPAPESTDNMNTKRVGQLGLLDAEEDALVSFMQTLTDGFMSRDQR